MTEPRRVETEFNRWSIALSALLHSLLCIGIVLIPSPSPISGGQEDSINVEIVSSTPARGQQNPVAPVIATEERPYPPVRQSAPPTTPEEMIKPGKEITPEPPVINHQNEKPTFIKPSQMLSESVLADRRSSRARQELKRNRPIATA